MQDPYMRRMVQDLYACRLLGEDRRDAVLTAFVEAVELEEVCRNYDTVAFFGRYLRENPDFAMLVAAREAERAIG